MSPTFCSFGQMPEAEFLNHLVTLFNCFGYRYFNLLFFCFYIYGVIVDIILKIHYVNTVCLVSGQWLCHQRVHHLPESVNLLCSQWS